MSLFKRIEDELHSSIKDGNELKVSTLRMLKSDIMYEKTKTASPLSEEKVLEIVSRAGKKRKESIVEFEKAGRQDLADKEKAELAIIELYLPAQMGADEITAFIDNKIAESGMPAPNEKGKFIGSIMKDLKGKADGNVVKEIVDRKLAQ